MYSILLGSLVLYSGSQNQDTQFPVKEQEKQITVSITPAPKKAVVVKKQKPAAKMSSEHQRQVRAAIVEEFGEGHVMVAVASCESRFNQFYTDGSVVRGKQNSKDVGAFQINEHYHLATANKLGISIYTLEGNIAYARYLYDTQGAQPWHWSEHQVPGTRGWAYGECVSVL